LHYAASYGHLDTVQVLLARNADVNATATTGETPLLAGIHKHDIAMLILGRGAEVNVEWALDGTSPLHKAANSGDIELLKRLLEKGAKINKQTTFGFTPVQMSTFQSNPEVVKILLDHGADVQLKAENGMAALHFAVSHSVFDIIWLLSKATLQKLRKNADESVLDVEKFFGPQEEARGLERIELLSRLCQAFDDDHIYPFIAAIELWDDSQHDRAIEFFHRVLELDPHNVNLSHIDSLQHLCYFGDYDTNFGAYQCDDCHKPVVGPRYSCKQCGDYDLCSQCYPKPSWPRHESKDAHELVRIPREDWTPKVRLMSDEK